MKIGIMLRHLGQHGGGVVVYTHHLLREMVLLNSSHEFVLLYQDEKFMGRYSSRRSNVREAHIDRKPAFLWDQLGVRQAEKKEKFDAIFNPKYSVPLTAECPTIFVCHGLDWYVMPWGSRWFDRLSHKYLIPKYARKAAAIIAVSNSTKQHLMKYLGVEEERIHTVYHGVEKTFCQPVPPEVLEETQRRFNLPKLFFLYVGQIYPPKNFGRLIQAYAQVGPKLGLSLVVAGSHTWLSEADIATIDRVGVRDWVIRPGWIDRATLPSFYALAKALVLPSLYESFGIPILEAMASGCPVVTSNRYGTAEIAGKAAVLVDPEDVASIASAMCRVATDDTFRIELIRAGRARAQQFHWKGCATQTLEVIEAACARRR